MKVPGTAPWIDREACRIAGHLEAVQTRTHHPKDLHENVVTVLYCPRCLEILNPEVLAW